MKQTWSVKNSYYILFSQHKWLIIQETSKTVIVVTTIYIALLQLNFKLNIFLFGKNCRKFILAIRNKWLYLCILKLFRLPAVTLFLSIQIEDQKMLRFHVKNMLPLNKFNTFTTNHAYFGPNREKLLLPLQMQLFGMHIKFSRFSKKLIFIAQVFLKLLTPKDMAT